MGDYKKEDDRALPEQKKKLKYQHLLDMKVRDPDTKKGEVILYENTEKNYMLLCSGVIPRYNKKFAPMHWAFAISEDQKDILIQRTA